MKSELINAQINPPLIPGQQEIGRTDGQVEIKPVSKDPAGHSDIDAMQLQPPKLEQADASSNQSIGESSAIQVRRQQRSSGVRTKKLKTEVVGSMARPGRAAFHQVHDLVGQ